MPEPKSPPELKYAIALHRAGDIAGAVAAYGKILQARPGDADTTSNLAVGLRALGEMAEALALLEEGAASHPGHIDLQYNFANALRDAGELDRAAKRYRHVLGIQAAHLGALVNLGLVLKDLELLEDAVRHHEDALRQYPEHAELHANLGLVIWRYGDLDRAIECYRAETRDPEILYGFGLALEAYGDHHEAEKCLREVVGMKPDDADALSGMGQVLLSLGRLEPAQALFDRALTAKPDHLDANLGRARGDFLTGDLIAGWQAYEWRRRRAKSPVVDPPGRRWAGEDPAGKAILLYGEQGIGDIIQFARYAPLLAERAARVVIACPAAVARLFATLDGVDQILAQGAPLPAYDFYSWLMDLPGVFGTTLETIPADCPYIGASGGSANTDSVGGIDAGLVWAGDPRHPKDHARSAGLQALLPLSEISGVSFVSLQTGPRARDLTTVAGAGHLPDIGSGLTDFADTAEVLAGLDLLITVDTAIAYLAGALARPVWVLLPFAPDWRWLLERDDTPWYPTMRLFRQPAPGDWQAVIDDVGAALHELTAR